MANESSKLHIFPCSNRTVNQGDNYVTQNNLVTVIRKLVGKDSFVVSTTYDADPFCFFIKGYYVEISGGIRTYTSSGLGRNLYASIDVSSGYLLGSDSDATPAIQSFITFSENSGDLLLVDLENEVPLSSRTINTLAKVDDGLLSDLV